MKLNLGCGKTILKGFINLDIVKSPGVDIIHNLEKTPLPFKDGQFEYILADNCLEHVSNFLPLMEDLWRISKNNAIVHIIVPHCRSIGAFSDPTHKRFFSSSTFLYFEKDNPHHFYISSDYKLISKRLVFGFEDAKTALARLYNIIMLPVQAIANISPSIYEILFSGILAPTSIDIKLKVLK